MKNLLLYITAGLSLLFIRCSEDVHIKSDFQEQYVLDCVLSADTNYQVAYLSRSFDTEGFIPDEYEGNPFISGAQIRIFEGNDVFVFREAQTDSLPGFNFSHPVTYYYLEDYTPEPRENLEIVATLPNGESLSATQTTFEYNFNYLPFYRGTIPPADTSVNEIEFRAYSNLVSFYFVPRIEIFYKHASNENEVKSFEVPMDYIERNDELIPVYPPIFKYLEFNYNRRIMALAMEQISAGDDLKFNYRIMHGKMSMLILNENLAAHYSAQNFSSDNYSVIVTKPEYTNVQGGKGIFGSFALVSNKINIDQRFIESFGYVKGN